MSITLDTPFATVALTGGYILQVNEFDSTAALNLTTDGSADFKVASSSVNVATGGEPGAYSSIYYGNHWGTVSTETVLPIPVSSIVKGGVALSSWTISTASVAAGSTYDCAYDIWFAPSTSVNQDDGACLEMMVWLSYVGVSPAGSKVVSGASIAGHTFDVWYSPGKTVSYVFTSQVQSVTALDIGLLAADSIARGYLLATAYLIDVEAGFELWINGTGLQSVAFSVAIGSTPVVPTPPVVTVPVTGLSVVINGVSYTITGAVAVSG
jgi:hypothetical protein